MIEAIANPLQHQRSAIFYICPNVKTNRATNRKPLVYCEPKPTTQPKPQETEATALVNK
jgi:hypothetical protein